MSAPAQFRAIRTVELPAFHRSWRQSRCQAVEPSNFAVGFRCRPGSLSGLYTAIPARPSCPRFPISPGADRARIGQSQPFGFVRRIRFSAARYSFSKSSGFAGGAIAQQPQPFAGHILAILGLRKLSFFTFWPLCAAIAARLGAVAATRQPSSSSGYWRAGATIRALRQGLRFHVIDGVGQTAVALGDAGDCSRRFRILFPLFRYPAA